MISADVKKVFEENPWFLATCGDEPNVVPVGFKSITEDGKFAIGAVLLDTTIENLKKNPKIAIAAANPASTESYQVKGVASFVTEGAVYDQYVKMVEEMFKGAMKLKCVIAVTPEKLIVATPNARNREELPL